MRRYRDVTWEAGTGETEEDRPVLSHVVVHRHNGAGRVVEVEEWPEGEPAGARVLSQTRWDVLGRGMGQWSADGGVGWVWHDGSGKPVVRWRGGDDDVSDRMRMGYDEAERPVRLWVREGRTGTERLGMLQVYGELHPEGGDARRVGSPPPCVFDRAT